MTRESVDTKARRYLCEARVTLVEVSPLVVTASVRGSDSVYTVTATKDGWRCDCAARGRCTHIVAVSLVAVKPARKR